MEIKKAEYWQVSDGNDIILDGYGAYDKAVEAAEHWFAENMVGSGVRMASEDFWAQLYDFEQDKVLEERKFTVNYDDTEARDWIAGQSGWVNV